MTGGPLYLFSVDVEDPRTGVAGGDALPPRVPEMVDLYLQFLERHSAKGTFFVVGEVARCHPELVRRIAGAGHELGCHSNAHIPLDRQDQGCFRQDLLRNLDALAQAGELRGYRAPCFSLTAETRWAYEVLAELGFDYSSSVLPGRSPLYGWPGFGTSPRMVDDILELPVTLLPTRLLPLPVGGVYFRVLPRPLLRWALRGRRRDTVLGYHHPYDIDTGQSFTHAGFRRWGLYDLLLRANRKAVLPRLEMVRNLGFSFAPYGPHAQRVRAELQS
jgi:polysaccharide deacetylase family protein (PEP-CTERM system associated)